MRTRFGTEDEGKAGEESSDMLCRSRTYSLYNSQDKHIDGVNNDQGNPEKDNLPASSKHSQFPPTFFPDNTHMDAPSSKFKAPASHMPTSALDTAHTPSKENREHQSPLFEPKDFENGSGKCVSSIDNSMYDPQHAAAQSALDGRIKDSDSVKNLVGANRTLRNMYSVSGGQSLHQNQDVAAGEDYYSRSLPLSGEVLELFRRAIVKRRQFDHLCHWIPGEQQKLQRALGDINGDIRDVKAQLEDLASELGSGASATEITQRNLMMTDELICQRMKLEKRKQDIHRKEAILEAERDNWWHDWMSLISDAQWELEQMMVDQRIIEPDPPYSDNVLPENDRWSPYTSKASYSDDDIAGTDQEADVRFSGQGDEGTVKSETRKDPRTGIDQCYYTPSSFRAPSNKPPRKITTPSAKDASSTLPLSQRDPYAFNQLRIFFANSGFALDRAYNNFHAWYNNQELQWLHFKSQNRGDEAELREQFAVYFIRETSRLAQALYKAEKAHLKMKEEAQRAGVVEAASDKGCGERDFGYEDVDELASVLVGRCDRPRIDKWREFLTGDDEHPIPKEIEWPKPEVGNYTEEIASSQNRFIRPIVVDDNMSIHDGEGEPHEEMVPKLVDGFKGASHGNNAQDPDEARAEDCGLASDRGDSTSQDRNHVRGREENEANEGNNGRDVETEDEKEHQKEEEKEDKIDGMEEEDGEEKKEELVDKTGNGVEEHEAQEIEEAMDEEIEGKNEKADEEENDQVQVEYQGRECEDEAQKEIESGMSGKDSAPETFEDTESKRVDSPSTEQAVTAMNHSSTERKEIRHVPAHTIAPVEAKNEDNTGVTDEENRTDSTGKYEMNPESASSSPPIQSPAKLNSVPEANGLVVDTSTNCTKTTSASKSPPPKIVEKRKRDLEETRHSREFYDKKRKIYHDYDDYARISKSAVVVSAQSELVSEHLDQRSIERNENNEEALDDKASSEISTSHDEQEHHISSLNESLAPGQQMPTERPFSAPRHTSESEAPALNLEIMGQKPMEDAEIAITNAPPPTSLFDVKETTGKRKRDENDDGVNDRDHCVITKPTASPHSAEQSTQESVRGEVKDTARSVVLEELFEFPLSLAMGKRRKLIDDYRREWRDGYK